MSIKITTTLTEDESRMVISALSYVRHPEFLGLADRLTEELWAAQPADAPF